MTSRKALLNNLLHSLVQEWGHAEVEEALASLSSTRGVPAAAQRYDIRTGSRRSQKLSASEQVARAQLSDAQRHVLQELGARFDRKEFLPSSFDVREFVALLGGKPVLTKNRSETFRRLLDALTQMPVEELEQLANSARFSGPSTLGPLSEAISAASTSLVRQRKSSDT